MFRWLAKTFGWVIDLATGRKKQPTVVFGTVIVMDTPPPLGEVRADRVYVVAPKSIPKWAMLRCPCGCAEVITLSLQSIHDPNWAVKIKHGRASLYPSVWRTTGCRSHFWLRDGRVFWA